MVGNQSELCHKYEVIGSELQHIIHLSRSDEIDHSLHSHVDLEVGKQLPKKLWQLS